MAGVKISKLKPYDEIFHDESFKDKIEDMIIPVSLGQKTLSIRVKELLNILNSIDDDQNEALAEHYQLILNNTELINQMTEQIYQRISELQAEAEQTHEQMKEEQKEVDTAQDERMGHIEDSIQLWEIYGSE